VIDDEVELEEEEGTDEYFELDKAAAEKSSKKNNKQGPVGFTIDFDTGEVCLICILRPHNTHLTLFMLSSWIVSVIWM
jgi:hypothetical protein